MKILFLSLIILISNSHADEFKDLTSKQVEKILNDEIPEIESNQFDEVDFLSNYLKRGEKKKIPLPPIKLKEAPTPPKPFRAVIEKGSTIYKRSENKYYKTKKKYFIWARELIEGGKFAYILDSKKQVTYLTLTKNLASIEDDIALYPKEDARVTYHKEKDYKEYDSKQDVVLQFNYSAETYSNSHIAEVAGLSESTAASNNFGLSALLKTNGRFNFGIEGYIKSGSYSGDATWTELTSGLLSTYRFTDSPKRNWEVLLFAHKSLTHSLESSTASFSFSQISWGPGIQAIFDTALGEFSVGSRIGFNKASSKPTDTTTSFNKSNSFDNSISLTFGYRWGLTL